MTTEKTTKKILSLTIKERIILPGILPGSGKKIEMILVSDIAKRVEFTPLEIAEFNLKDLGNGRIIWDPRKEKALELELTDQQIELLKGASKRLDEEGKVTRDNLTIIEKIDEL